MLDHSRFKTASSVLGRSFSFDHTGFVVVVVVELKVTGIEIYSGVMTVCSMCVLSL